MSTLRSGLRDLGIALSLANLCLLRMWTSVLAPPSVMRADHAAAILDMALVSLLLWVLARTARRVAGLPVFAVARGFLVLLALTCVPSLTRALWPAVEVTNWFAPARMTFFVALALAVVALTVAGRGPRTAATTCRILLALLPATFVTVGRSAWQLGTLTYRRAPAAQPAAVPVKAAEPAPNSHGARVVVLLLDELDYAVAFAARPRTVSLPALDRLRREAVSASHAYPPEPSTVQSVPTYLTGKLVPEAALTANGDLLVRFDGTAKRVSMSTEPTIFTELRRLGMRSAVVGRMPPYARLFGHDARCLDPCQGGALWTRLAGLMLYHATTAAADSPIPTPRGILQVRERLTRESDLGAYGGFMSAAAQAAMDRTLSFVLMHAPVPHAPYIFDRTTGRISSAPGHTYYDNLALADQTLARLRATMEAGGTWDGTNVLVIADHFWRERPADLAPHDHRVPFILKLAGQRAGVPYDRPFNTVLFHDLVLAVTRGQLHKPEEVVAWLDRHRTFGESPLTVGFGAQPEKESASEKTP